MSSSKRNKKTVAQQQPGVTQQATANRSARPSRPGGSSGGGQGTTSTMNADPEGQAIMICLDALRPLQQPGARARVVNYVVSRYNVHLTGWQGQAGETEGQMGGEGSQTGNESFIGTGQQQQRTIGAGR